MILISCRLHPYLLPPTCTDDAVPSSLTRVHLTISTVPNGLSMSIHGNKRKKWAFIPLLMILKFCIINNPFSSCGMKKKMHCSCPCLCVDSLRAPVWFLLYLILRFPAPLALCSASTFDHPEASVSSSERTVRKLLQFRQRGYPRCTCACLSLLHTASELLRLCRKYWCPKRGHFSRAA